MSKRKEQQPFRNRIVRHSEEAPDQLLANPRNWRTHPGSQAEALRGVLGDVGYVQSVIVNERTGFLVDGHLRVQEALKAGQASIPVVWVDLSEAEEALVLATLDPVAALAGTDPAKLDDLLRDVSTDSAAVQAMLDTLATDAGVVPGVGEGAGGDEFDATPEDAGPTRAQPGDLWVIGGVHRLLVGDCTDPANVARLMGGERAGAVVTDPPYGVEKAGWDGAFPPVALWRLVAEQAVEGASVIVFPGVANLPPKLSTLASVFTYQWPIVWYKPNAMQFGKTGFSVLDIAWWFSVGTPTHRPQRRDVIVDAIVPSQNDFGHESPKQVGVMLELMDFAPDAALTFDPFLGSGTTLIAAHRTGRRCYGLELEPRYADVILRRAEAEGLSVERVEP